MQAHAAATAARWDVLESLSSRLTRSVTLIEAMARAHEGGAPAVAIVTSADTRRAWIVVAHRVVVRRHFKQPGHALGSQTGIGNPVERIPNSHDRHHHEAMALGGVTLLVAEDRREFGLAEQVHRAPRSSRSSVGTRGGSRPQPSDDRAGGRQLPRARRLRVDRRGVGAVLGPVPCAP